MLTIISSEPTRNEVYERVRNLLKDYYRLSGQGQGGIELTLEKYSLNGKEIIGLFDEVIEFNQKYMSLENDFSTARGDIGELEEEIRTHKKFREKLETLAIVSDGLMGESQSEALKKLLKDFSDTE